MVDPAITATGWKRPAAPDRIHPAAGSTI